MVESVVEEAEGTAVSYSPDRAYNEGERTETAGLEP